MDPQNIPIPPSRLPLQPEHNNTVIAPVLVTIAITALIVGLGMLLWQQNKYQMQIADLTKGLETVTADNAALKVQISDLNKTASDTITQKEDIEKKACKGVWNNGVCVKSACVDSDVNYKPEDIYIKGTVTYTDENGVETVVPDECTGSKKQVNEMWCYESPAGSSNYVQGKMIYNCTRGCRDGACIK